MLKAPFDGIGFQVVDMVLERLVFNRLKLKESLACGFHFSMLNVLCTVPKKENMMDILKKPNNDTYDDKPM